LELDTNTIYDVSVTAFTNCKSFYVQIINDNDQWDKMNQMIERIPLLKPLHPIHQGKLCLVKLNDKLSRGKVIRHSEDSVMIFCVDSGDLLFFLKEEIQAFEIPKSIVDILPFQAINCRLAGIVAPSNYLWTHKIYRSVIQPMLEQKIRVLKKLEGNLDMLPCGLEDLNCYDVELFEGVGGKETIGDILVKYQLADYDI
jgi:hypothetical protein